MGTTPAQVGLPTVAHEYTRRRDPRLRSRASNLRGFRRPPLRGVAAARAEARAPSPGTPARHEACLFGARGGGSTARGDRHARRRARRVRGRAPIEFATIAVERRGRALVPLVRSRALRPRHRLLSVSRRLLLRITWAVRRGRLHDLRLPLRGQRRDAFPRIVRSRRRERAMRSDQGHGPRRRRAARADADAPVSGRPRNVLRRYALPRSRRLRVGLLRSRHQ